MCFTFSTDNGNTDNENPAEGMYDPVSHQDQGYLYLVEYQCRAPKIADP